MLYPWDEDHIRIDAVSLNPDSRGKPRELSIDDTSTVEDHLCVDIGSGSNGASEHEIVNKRTVMITKATDIPAHVILLASMQEVIVSQNKVLHCAKKMLKNLINVSLGMPYSKRNNK